MCLVLALFVSQALAESFSLKSREDRKTLMFSPKGPGKVTLSGKWEGSAKSMDIALYHPSQFLARWRGSVTKNPFEMSWDLAEKDLEESTRPWKVVLRAKGGEAEGEAEMTGSAIEPGEEKPVEEKPWMDKAAPSKGKSATLTDVEPAKKGEEPALPLDEFGMRVRRTLVETAFYKPWIDKIAAGQKNAKIAVRPLGLTVSPGLRKIRSRYGSLSLTIRNITLTPGQNVNLQEAVSGSAETSLEVVIRVEIPGWYLLAMQVEPYAAYPGEPARMTAMQIETRSLSQGTLEPATSWPFSGTDALLLTPMLFSQPGEYVCSAKPIAREPGEILFVLRGIELYRLSS